MPEEGYRTQAPNVKDTGGRPEGYSWLEWFLTPATTRKHELQMVRAEQKSTRDILTSVAEEAAKKGRLGFIQEMKPQLTKAFGKDVYDIFEMDAEFYKELGPFSQVKEFLDALQEAEETRQPTGVTPPPATPPTPTMPPSVAVPPPTTFDPFGAGRVGIMPEEQLRGLLPTPSVRPEAPMAAPTAAARPSVPLNVFQDFSERVSYNIKASTGEVTLSIGPKKKKTLKQILDDKAIQHMQTINPDDLQIMMDDYIENATRGKPEYKWIKDEKAGTTQLHIYRGGKVTKVGDPIVTDLPAAEKVAQKVPATELERSYANYRTAREEQGLSVASLEFYKTARANIESVINDYSPAPGFMGIPEKLNPEQRKRKTLAWMQQRQALENLGVLDPYLLRYMTGRILTNLGYQAAQIEELETQYLKAVYKSLTLPALQPEGAPAPVPTEQPVGGVLGGGVVRRPIEEE